MTDLMAPMARYWQRRVQTQLNAEPRPLGSERQFARGPDPDRVLVLGNGPAIGFGVRSQELALPGQLARQLAATTGRGASVDIAARRGTTIAGASALLDGVRLVRYDAILLTVGATDAYGFLPVEQWRERLAAFLGLLREASTPTTELVVLAASPLQRSRVVEGPMVRTAGRHAERLDAASEAVCAELDRTTFVRAPVDPLSVGPRSAQAYAELAERIVPAIAERLDALAHETDPSSARVLRRRPDPEILRQAALDRTRLSETESDERLDRLVRSARDLFGTRGASVTLIDGEVQRHASSISLDNEEIARAGSVCNRTIRGDQALVIGDLAAGPAPDVSMRSGGQPVRFYAGYPIESPDGYRIGALCVFDTDPRDAASIDEAALAELAALVQNDLWSMAARHSG